MNDITLSGKINLNDYLSTREAARHIDVLEITIRNMLSLGKIQRYKIKDLTVVKIAELNAYHKAHTPKWKAKKVDPIHVGDTYRFPDPDGGIGEILVTYRHGAKITKAAVKLQNGRTTIFDIDYILDFAKTIKKPSVPMECHG